MKFTVNIPLDKISSLFLRFRTKPREATLSLRIGARYEVGGEVFIISEVYAYAVVLRPANPELKLVRVA